jgi:hypothetical protein
MKHVIQQLESQRDHYLATWNARPRFLQFQTSTAEVRIQPTKHPLDKEGLLAALAEAAEQVRNAPLQRIQPPAPWWLRLLRSGNRQRRRV